MIHCCPMGFKFNGHEYHVPSVSKNKADAVAHCAQMGAGLAVVDDNTELIFLQSILHQLNPSQNHDYYIGKIIYISMYANPINRYGRSNVFRKCCRADIRRDNFLVARIANIMVTPSRGLLFTIYTKLTRCLDVYERLHACFRKLYIQALVRLDS